MLPQAYSSVPPRKQASIAFKWNPGATEKMLLPSLFTALRFVKGDYFPGKLFVFNFKWIVLIKQQNLFQYLLIYSWFTKKKAEVDSCFFTKFPGVCSGFGRWWSGTFERREFSSAAVFLPSQSLPVPAFSFDDEEDEDEFVTDTRKCGEEDLEMEASVYLFPKTWSICQIFWTVNNKSAINFCSVSIIKPVIVLLDVPPSPCARDGNSCSQFLHFHKWSISVTC